VAAWKRTALLVLSVLLIAGTLALALYAFTSRQGNGNALWLLLIPLLGLSVLGLVVALRGCSTCVGRIFGGI
jgi:hypothetical protein